MSEQLDESRRLTALRRLMVLDSSAETAYDDITRLASQTFGAPISLISLIDEDRQWFKSRVGLEMQETPRDWSFCSHAIEQPDEVLVVRDAQLDPRFRNNPMVTGSPHIRFYAGAPLVTATGEAIGSLCVIDSKPRDIDPAKLAELQFLAAQVVAMMQKRAEFTGLFEPGRDDAAA
ncbi:MAG: GAF domain-containing protein [Burkholderiales bacterium]|nr:GAF domain-containing protein [Burkholderiales bacterium]